MSAFFSIFFLSLLAFAMIAALLTVACVSAWKLVYYVMGCRKAPVQKTVLTAAVLVWVVTGGILALLH